MKIKTWRLKEKLTLKMMADRISAITGVNIDPATLSRWENGLSQPRRQSLRAIIIVTGGKVTANDFMEVLAKPVPVSEARNPL